MSSAPLVAWSARRARPGTTTSALPPQVPSWRGRYAARRGPPWTSGGVTDPCGTLTRHERLADCGTTAADTRTSGPRLVVGQRRAVLPAGAAPGAAGAAAPAVHRLLALRA